MALTLALPGWLRHASGLYVSSEMQMHTLFGQRFCSVLFCSVCGSVLFCSPQSSPGQECLGINSSETFEPQAGMELVLLARKCTPRPPWLHLELLHLLSECTTPGRPDCNLSLHDWCQSIEWPERGAIRVLKTHRGGEKNIKNVNGCTFGTCSRASLSADVLVIVRHGSGLVTTAQARRDCGTATT